MSQDYRGLPTSMFLRISLATHEPLSKKSYASFLPPYKSSLFTKFPSRCSHSHSSLTLALKIELASSFYFKR